MDSYCVIRDDMEPLYEKIVSAGALVIASPIYWFSVSAQTKLFMDRLYAFLGPGGNRLTGMAMGVLLAYGDTDPVNSGAINAIRTFQDAFAYIGAPLVGMVYGSAMDKGDIEKSPEVLAAAHELGIKIVAAIE
jgi:multimeric flavodoxin WrbA